MPTFDGLLMRDSLSDLGAVPSPGYPYYSPDLIAHAQVADPQTFFKNNYASDPNQAVQLGSGVNFIYVRTKNVSPTAKSGWYISVYRSNSSLFMTPSIWKQNRLSTRMGQNYVTLGTLQPSAIGVGKDHFLLSGLKSHLFCLIGIASATPNPTIPSSFNNYAGYITWVRQNQNICGRNLTTARNFANRQYERLDGFANPESKYVPTLFQVTANEKLPSGSTFGIVCAPLGINKSQKVDKSRIMTASGMTPKHFNGTVTTFGMLPTGMTRWPSGAKIDTTVYVGQKANDPVALYAEDVSNLAIEKSDMVDLVGNGVLVLLGSTGTEFVNVA